MARFFDFALGIVLYRCYLHNLDDRKCLQSYAMKNLMEGAAIILYAACMWLYYNMPVKYSTTAIWLAPNAILIVLFVYYDNRGGFVSRLLSSKLCVRTGELSFVVYMTHQIVIRYVGAILHSVNMRDEKFIKLAFLIFIYIAIGVTASLTDKYLTRKKIPLRSVVGKKFFLFKSTNNDA